jgi:predicted Zn-dependent peptidase
MDIHIFSLTNGIQVVYKEIPASDVSHCGIIIDAGSRDELQDEQGLAHFIEHGLFKGTKKRKAFHILNRLDIVGGEINAYTTKETTCIFASFLNEHFERAMELLQDITFHSTFPAKEIEKEKDVIIDEIHSYLDSPAEQIYDDFEDLIFEGHPIGRNILGTVESVRSFSPENIHEFIRRNYNTGNIVISVTGSLSLPIVKNIAFKYFQNIPGSNSIKERKVFKNYNPKEITRKRESTFQAHHITGGIAYSRKNPKRFPLILLNNLLGGPAMNSRLNLAIREKYGYTYNLESNYAAYSDTGIFSIYLGTDLKYLNKTISLVHKELQKLREKKLGKMQLHYAKKQLIGQTAIAQENKAGLMLAIGKSLLYTGKVDTLEEVYGKIESVTAEELLEVANEIFTKESLSSLTFTSK